MKKLVFLFSAIFFLSLSFNGFAFSFRPSTVAEMDVEVLLAATGNFLGVFSAQDSAQVRMLTFNDSETQQIEAIEEKLFIGQKIIEPHYEFEGNNKIAVFEIEGLKEFENDPDFEIEIRARIKTNAKIELDKGITEAANHQPFLEETKYIEVNDQELISKAELEFGSTQDLKTIIEITSWVNSNVEYDFENYYNGTWSAKDTYNSRKGVCDEFANLTAAFARIKKIPARYITGISFDGERFGNHGWLEVFLEDSGWIGLDSTYLEAGYLDGAHFKLATSNDASKAINLKIITKSVSPIEVSSVLELPQVKINKVKFFEGITQVTLSKPEKVNLGQDFEISAVAQNNLNSNVVIPVELALHENFLVREPARLVWFKPFEQKTISWKVTAPEKGEKGFFVKYGLFLFTPDSNITDSISVFPNQDAQENASDVKIVDISPFISENDLTIEVVLENLGKKEGIAKITATHKNSPIFQEQVEIKSFETKKVSFEIKEVGVGEVFLTIESDQSREVKIVVPEKKEEQIQVVDLPQELKKDDQQNFLQNNSSLIVTVALVLVIILLLFLNSHLSKLK